MFYGWLGGVDGLVGFIELGCVSVSCVGLGRFGWVNWVKLRDKSNLELDLGLQQGLTRPA